MDLNDIHIPFIIENSKFNPQSRGELSHWHNSFELIEILDGNFLCHVAGEEFEAAKGDLCIINKGQLHRVLNEKQEKERYQTKTLIFDPDFFIKNEDIYHKYVLPLQDDYAFSHMKLRRDSGIGSEIYLYIDELEELNHTKPLGYEAEMVALIYMIISRLYLAHISQKDMLKKSYDQNQMTQKKMNHFIYEHYADKLTLEDIAEAGMVSKSTCIRLFKHYTGISPIEFLNRYRLEMSCRLLRDTDTQITEIAYSTGFSQASYYNRVFTKEFGLTPSQYRKSGGREIA